MKLLETDSLLWLFFLHLGKNKIAILFAMWLWLLLDSLLSVKSLHESENCSEDNTEASSSIWNVAGYFSNLLMLAS